jgi:protease-4
MTAAERAMIERYIGGLAAQSYEALGAARGAKLPGGAAAAIGGGPYIDPTAAVGAGLVDALMYRDEFDDAVKEKTADAPTVDLRSYARERGLSWGAPVAKKVAVVYLTGSIIEGPGVAGQSIGDSAAELLASLRDDATVAGVLLRVDSGGGSALTSDHIAREVKKLKEAGKPVVVSMASYAASGGYYVSAFADRIVAEAGTLTGSIGVTGLNFSFVGALEKLGVGADGVSAGDSGLFGNPFLPRRDGDDAVMRSGIEYIYGRFVDVVAEGRKMDKARVDELGKGQIWLGSEALANGLIDEIGGLDAAKAAMAGLLDAKVKYQDYQPGDDPVSPLMAMFGSALSPAAGAAGSVSGAVLDAVRFADDVAAMGDGILYLAPEYLYRERP